MHSSLGSFEIIFLPQSLAYAVLMQVLLTCETMNLIFGILVLWPAITHAQYLQYCDVCTCSFEKIIRIKCIHFPPSQMILQTKYLPGNVMLDFRLLARDNFDRLAVFEKYLLRITSNVLFPNNYNMISSPVSNEVKEFSDITVKPVTISSIGYVSDAWKNKSVSSTLPSDDNLSHLEKSLISALVLSVITCIALIIALILTHIKHRLQSNERIIQMQNLEL